MTLHIAPTNWLSWNFKVSAEARPVADIAISPWRERGTVAIDGTGYRVYRAAPLAGAFILEGPGGEIARAEKPSILGRAFAVRHGGRDYMLRPRAMFRREFVLLDGAREIGSLAPRSIFTRKAAVELPPDLPISLRMFIVWLTMISWRRDNE